MATRGSGRRVGGGRDGFLLVEALSALAISALLIAALLSFTGLLRRSADRAALRVETLEATNRTVWTIASEIRQATRLRWAPQERPAAAATPTPAAAPPGQRGAPQGGPPGQFNAPPRAPNGEDGPDQTGGGQQPPAGGQQGAEQQPDRDFVFSGGPDRLIFALAPEQADGLRAAVMVVYQIDPSGAVLRAEGGIRPEDKGADAVRLGPVLRVEPGPERLRFAYVEKDGHGNETVAEDWTDARRMPAAVRIDRVDPASGQLVGSLRAPILLTGEPGCVDPGQGFCSRESKPKPAAAQAGGRPAQNGGRPPNGQPE